MRNITRIEPTSQQLPTLKKVAAYARVSSGKDAMLQSLAAQVSYYSEYIQNHSEWQYVGVYADESQTGTKDDRLEFQRLLSDCRAGKIDMILTKSISRFARNTVTLLTTVRELKGYGIDVYFEEQNIHSHSSDGELMLTVLASYAQEESLSASENCKWRIRKSFEEGKVSCCTMLGYRSRNGVLEIVPNEAETVKLIFTLFLEGLGKQAITNRLSEKGLLSRFGNEWHLDTVAKILRNNKYCGDLLLQKTFRTDHLTKRTMKNNGELPMYFVSDAHEPIIDRTTFEAVQKELDRRAKEFEIPQGSFSAFTSKIRCGICGKNYRRKTTKTGIIWCCATYNTKGKKHCASKQIPEITLFVVTADILGLNTFDETVFAERIAQITALSNNLLEYHFTDGRSQTVQWQDRSRSESWTAEMRQAAREKITRGGFSHGKMCDDDSAND